MTSKDKLIGVALIIIGAIFIFLGVSVGTKQPGPITNNNGVYTEQQQQDNNQPNTNVVDDVDVYTEPQAQEGTVNNSEEGPTRYIY